MPTAAAPNTPPNPIQSRYTPYTPPNHGSARPDPRYHRGECPAVETFSRKSDRSRPATCPSPAATSCIGSRWAIREASRCCSCTAGPGAGAGAVHRRFFDPAFWRVVIFDQRGAGRSRPLGSLVANTTADLVQDIEQLRRHLGLERWLLFGGSWGSTLALAYAQAHPKPCGRPGAARRVPGTPGGGGLVPARPGDDLPRCARPVRPVPAGARARRHPRLLPAPAEPSRPGDPHVGGTRLVGLRGSCSTLLPSPDTVASFAQDRTALGLARIEAHYFATTCSCRRRGCWAAWTGSATLPAEIVQGRYDMVCPPRTAFELAAAWPAARLTVIPDAGHSALEPGIRRSLVAAVERFRHAR